MNYGLLTLVPIVIVIALALITKRTLEPLILGTLCTYLIIDGAGFAQGWMDAFFRVVRQPHCPAGRLARHAGFFQMAEQAVQGAALYPVYHMGDGHFDFCGRLPQYHDAEHLHEKADRPQ